MALLRTSQNSFVAGRLSPRLYGRADIAQYQSGLKQAHNFVIFPHGGASFRSGTRYVGATKTASKRARLIPFVFSTSNVYVLEIGEGYGRVYTNHAQLTSGGSPVEVTLPYVEADLPNLSVAQSGDIVYIACAGKAPREIRRNSATSWTTALFDYQDGPYEPENATTTTLTPSAVTGSITITASAVTGINGGSGFLATDVGRHIRLLESGEWSWAVITAVGSTTSVTATVKRDFAATGAVTLWRLGVWTDTVPDNWPRCVTFHQQRIYFGGKGRFWGSTVASFLNFSPTKEDSTVDADGAIDATLATGRIDDIVRLSSARVLDVGTAGAEVMVSKGDASTGAIQSDNIKAQKTTEWGSKRTDPVLTMNGTVFLNRTGRKLLNSYYSFDNDNGVADDLTILSEDVLLPGGVEVGYASEPNTTIWVVRSDGQLAACTFNPKQEVVAWHTHAIADGVVEALTVVPSPDASVDDVWMIVRRTVGGSTVRHVEYLTPEFAPGADIEDAFFLDCGLTYSGSPVSTVTGLSHLVGKTVAALADGVVVAPQVVSAGGEITLLTPASEVQVGLPYYGVLELLPLERGDKTNPLLSRAVNVKRVGIEYYQTVLAEVGVTGERLEYVGQRTAADPLSTALPAKTGYDEVAVEGESAFRGTIRVEQNNPLPCTILAVYPILEYSERPI